MPARLSTNLNTNNTIMGLWHDTRKPKTGVKKNEELRQARRVKREQLNTFIATLLRQDSVLTEFDETPWFAVIVKVTINATDNIHFTFRDGTAIKAKYPLIN